MASLSEALRQQRNGTLKRGPGGQLSQESPEEIQSLAGQAGLQAPPITPMGAAALGANPDQQKMMGTPAQKTAAFTAAQAPVENGLAATVRRQQSRTDMTAEEQGQKAKSQDMQQLGSLGDRVTNFIDAQRQQLEAQSQAATTQNQLQVNAASDPFNGKDLNSIKDLLQTYRQNPTDQNTLLNLNKALGYDVNTQLSPAQVDQLYESVTDTIARGGAQNVNDSLTVTDLLQQPNFGYTPTQLSQLLGLPEDQIAKLTVSQLRDQINKVGTEEFSNSQKLQDQAQSGNLGASERGVAQQAGREASATGVRATEADYGNLEQQISQADHVFFDGKDYSVADLLKDDTISGIIKDYMNSAPDSDTRKTLEAKEPQLLDFINKNKAVLAEASQNMQAGAQTFTNTQTFNKGLQSIGGIKMQDSLIDAFLPQSKELQAQQIDPASVPVVAASQSLNPNQQRTYMSNLNSEVQNDPSTIQDLQGLTTDQVRSWDIGGDGNSVWNTNYVQPKRQYEAIVNAGLDGNKLVTIAARNVLNADDAQNKLGTVQKLGVLGFGPGAQSNPLDVNADGQLDDSSSIRANLLNSNPRPTLSNGPGNNKVYQAVDLQNPSSLDELQKGIYSALGDAAQKGSISDRDIASASSKLNLDQAIYLQDNKGKGNIDGGAVDRLWSEKRDDNTSRQLAEIYSQTGDPSSRIEKMNQMIQDQGVRRVNPDILGSETRKLLDQIAAADAQASAEDREKTRQRLRQQKQIIGIATYGIFSALPTEMQDNLMDTMTTTGGAVLDELKKVKWDNSKTIPENVASVYVQLLASPYKAIASGLGSIAQSIGGGMGGVAGDSIKNAGSAISNAVGSGGGTVLCTALYGQGFLSRVDWLNVDHYAMSRARKIDLIHYRAWGCYIADVMGKSVILSRALQPWITSWATYLGGTNDSISGRISYGILWIISKTLGKSMYMYSRYKRK